MECSHLEILYPEGKYLRKQSQLEYRQREAQNLAEKDIKPLGKQIILYFGSKVVSCCKIGRFVIAESGKSKRDTFTSTYSHGAWTEQNENFPLLLLL